MTITIAPNFKPILKVGLVCPVIAVRWSEGSLKLWRVKIFFYATTLIILNGCLTPSDGGSTGLFAPPPEVTGLSATVNSTTQITLNWTSGGSTTSDYRISYTTGATAPTDCDSGTTIAASAITGTSHAITGLTDDTQYAFRVCSINANPFPDVADGQTTSETTWQVPPPNPSGLSIAMDSDTAVTLSWTSGGGSTQDYRISYQNSASAPADCASGTQISEASISGTSEQITGLSSGRLYAFRVCAINGNPTPDVSSGITGSETVWWDGDWGRRRTLTFGNAAQSENLTNFPVLVVLTGGSNIDYAQTQDAGQDLRFIEPNSATELDYEIERWDESGTSYVWVEVPQIDGSSNTDYIWMYYGNAGGAAATSSTATWGGNYQGVWHLNEDPTLANADDATSNSNDGNIANDVAAVSANRIAGNAYAFDGTGDKVTVPQTAVLDIAGDTTIEGWFRLDALHNSASGTTQTLFSKYVDGNNDFAVALVGTDYLRANIPDGSLVFKLEQTNIAYKYTNASNRSWAANTWYYLALQLDASDSDNNKIFINGADVTDAADDVDFGAALDFNISDDFEFGGGALDTAQIAAGEGYLDGNMDEIRVSETLRSSDWIAAQYDSMTDGFITFGSEVNGP